jgi:cystathionine beta-lyase/cystathionine gamma-synthase
MCDLVIDPVTNHYSRSTFTTQRELIAKLARLYDLEHVLVTNSGMHAIYTSLQTYLIQNEWNTFNLIMADELYCDTKRLPTHIKHKMTNINVTTFDTKNPRSLLDLFKLPTIRGKRNVLFVESCSNPNGFVFDFSIIPELRSLSSSLFVIVDNTWLTSEIFNPFNHDVNVVVSSLTKYYSAGTAIAGFVIFRSKALYDIAEEHLRFTGCHMSPYDLSIISANIDTLKSRIISASLLTMDLLKRIPESKLSCIKHPSLPFHPSYELAKKYFCKFEEHTLYPSVFTFALGAPKRVCLGILQNNKKLKHETSFGSKYSKTDQWPTYDEKTRMTTCRLSVGYEDTVEHVLSGLEEIFAKIR